MASLVTGAGGFLGLYITEQLVARGERVRAYCRHRYATLDALKVETVCGDITDSAQLQNVCEGMDTVYHVAAISGIGEPWTRYYQTNTLGTRYLLEAARRAGVSFFVFTSSPSVTFDGSDQRYVNETVPYASRWLGHYPHSKALAEQQVLAENGVGGMQTCALRPHLIWGPRDQALIPRLLERARCGSLRQVGDGTNQVDMLYVENAAEAHVQAADAMRAGRPVAGNAYFLSQGEPVFCWDWIRELLTMMDLPPVKKTISLANSLRMGTFFETVWKLFRWKSDPPMTRFLAYQLARNHYFDIRRAQQDFGFTARVSTQEGMERLRHFLRNET